MPAALIESLGARIGDQLAEPGVVPVSNTSTTGEPTPCVVESCQLAAARAVSASTVLHTRLVQYAEHCWLLGLLYDAPTGQSLWAFRQAAACEAAPLEEAVSALTAAYRERPPTPAASAIHAVLPVQHEIDDVAFASDSYAEVLTTHLAAAGKTMVPASVVAVPREGQKLEARKGCPDTKCALELGANVGAHKSVATRIVKKRSSCTLTAAIHDLATKTATITATAKVGCEAHQLAGALRDLAEQLGR